MISRKIHNGATQWFVYGRDHDKPEEIIDTNQYLIKSGCDAILLDPGGIEIFAPMLTALVNDIELAEISHIFASHQDPDIISSLGLWDEVVPHATLHSPWLWKGFIMHFGMSNIRYHSIADEGGKLNLGGTTLEFIPAHYLHSSGNMHLYDPDAKILFSGDVGAALENISSPLFVEDFDSHIKHMELFHKRWMPSNKAKQHWIERVSKMDIDMMAPQHGRVFKGDDVKRFLDWFAQLDVGIAVE